MVLAAAGVPVGSYARAAFARLSGHAGFAADCAAAVERNVAPNELDLKTVATKIALGEGDAGVIYATDVTPSIASKVNVLTFPNGSVSAIAYPVATLKGASDASGAPGFLDFLFSDGQAYRRRRGFLAP